MEVILNLHLEYLLHLACLQVLFQGDHHHQLLEEDLLQGVLRHLFAVHLRLKGMYIP